MHFRKLLISTLLTFAALANVKIAFAQSYWTFSETSSSSTATSYGGSTVTGTSLGLASGTAVLNLYFSVPGATNIVAGAVGDIGNITPGPSTTIAQLVSTGAGQFYSGTISFGGGASYALSAIPTPASGVPGGFEIKAGSFNDAAGSLQLQFTQGASTYYVFSPPDADRLSIYNSKPTLIGTTGNTNTVGACTVAGCWATTIAAGNVTAVNINSLTQAQANTGGTGSIGAPEIDGSLAPKVGFLLGCLFLMFGRKKQNTEPMLTA